MQKLIQDLKVNCCEVKFNTVGTDSCAWKHKTLEKFQTTFLSLYA